MLNIWVRAKRDARKMPLVLRKYFKGWDIKVSTIKARSIKELASLPFDFSSFNIVVLGREDGILFEELSRYRSPLFGINFVNSPQVRTAKVSDIFKSIEYAKSEMRNGVELKEDFFVFNGENKLLAPLTFDTDCYFLYPGHGESLKKILNLRFKLPDYTVIFRDASEEFVFLKENEFFRIEKPDTGEIKALDKEARLKDTVEVDWEKTVEKNKDIVEKLVNEAVSFLKPYGDKKAVIPLSGGKDSQAVLDIAVKVWNRENLLCIHADTGFDFKENREHAEYLCDKYGVNLKVLDLELNKKGEPDFSRWCTFEKTEKMYKVAKEWGAEVYLMGDRDGESFKRRRKPRVRVLQDIVHLFPLKFWSTAHIQLLIALSGININPLYLKGFWRTGCKKCPFLTEWEKVLTKNS